MIQRTRFFYKLLRILIRPQVTTFQIQFTHELLTLRILIFASRKKLHLAGINFRE